MLRAITGVLLLSFLWGCQLPEEPEVKFPSHPPPPEHPVGARLSRSQVLTIAEKAYGRSRIRLEDVEMVLVPLEDRKVWSIYFAPLDAGVGGGSIHIDDATGKVKIHHAK